MLILRRYLRRGAHRIFDLFVQNIGLVCRLYVVGCLVISLVLNFLAWDTTFWRQGWDSKWLVINCHRLLRSLQILATHQFLGISGFKVFEHTWSHVVWTKNPFLTPVDGQFCYIALAPKVSAYFHRSMQALIRTKILQPPSTDISGPNIV